MSGVQTGREYPDVLRKAVVALAAAFFVLFAANGASATNFWTLTKTANPTTFSNVGDVIAYTYVITNSNSANGLLDSAPADDKVALVDCPSPLVPASGTLTCTGTYQITAADVAAGSVTNTVTVDGEGCLTQGNASLGASAGPLVSIEHECPEHHVASATVTLLASAPSWNLTKTPSPTTYSASGQSISYSYVLSNTGNAVISGISLADDKIASVSCPASSLAAGAQMTCTGTYVTTDADVSAGSVTNHAVAHASSVPDATAEATITKSDLSSGIDPFLTDRTNQLLNDEPDRPQYTRRFTGSVWGGSDDGSGGGGGSAYAPVDFSMAGSGANGVMSVSTSLQKVMAFADMADGGGVAGGSTFHPVDNSNPVNLWTEAHYKFGTGRQDFRFASWYMGADYLVRPSLLVGILSQVDWTKERVLNISGTAEGVGWMVGPYASVHLAPNLYLDGRVAWGRSNNAITAAGATDKFTTDRLLARAKLTGNWQRGAWRVTPSVALAYLSEMQEAYTGSNGVAVPSSTVSTGRLTAGPEVGRRIIMEDGGVVEPMASVVLNWDFASSGASNVPAVSGLATAAVMLTRPSGVTMRGAMTYGGIGTADYQTFGLQYWLSIPLN